jgi:hypothetical protein
MEDRSSFKALPQSPMKQESLPVRGGSPRLEPWGDVTCLQTLLLLSSLWLGKE